MENSSLSKEFIRQRGIGLVEALISISILGVIAVGLISQQKLSTDSNFSVTADAEINNLMRRVTAEISDEATCSANFSGNNFGSSEASATHYDSLRNAADTNLIITTLASDPNSVVGSAQSNSLDIKTKTTLGEVQINNIKVWKKSGQEIIVRIFFKRKNSTLFSKFQAQTVSKDITLNTIYDYTVSPSVIKSCFGDYDLIATSAIETACRGEASIYEPPSDLYKYGRCIHENSDLTCPAGQYLYAVNASKSGTNGRMTYACRYPKANTCPAGQFINTFNADGTVTCSTNYAHGFKCAAGQVIVKNSSGALVCSTIDCTGYYPIAAFAGFDAAGNQICNQITSANSCGTDNFASQVNTNGSITCNPSVINGGSCPTGSHISGLDANGGVICTKWINIPFNCGGGAGFKTINASGDPVCEAIQRPLACDGTQKNHSYSDCYAWGGSVQYGYGGNSHCVFSGASCPGGWNRCYSFGSQTTTACLDTSNTYYCDGSRSWRYAYAPGGDWAYGNNGQPMATCYQWTGFPNTGHGCYPYAVQNIWTTQQQVGCY